MTHFVLNGARRLGALLLVMGVGSALLFGCGGGGGSGGGGGGGGTVPTPAPTVPTSNTVVVQLRDTLGNPVDGVVTLSARRQATTGGNVAFANAVSGAQTVSAEVNGRTYSQNFVATAGTTTVQIIINPQVTPTPVGTLPAPPPL